MKARTLDLTFQALFAAKVLPTQSASRNILLLEHRRILLLCAKAASLQPAAPVDKKVVENVHSLEEWDEERGGLTPWLNPAHY